MGFTKTLISSDPNLVVVLHVELDPKRSKATHNGKEYSITNKNLSELFTTLEKSNDVRLLTELVFRFIFSNNYDLVEKPSFNLDEKTIEPKLSNGILKFCVTQSGLQDPIPYQVSFPLKGGSAQLKPLHNPST